MPSILPISAIVPTLDRKLPFERMLTSLAEQSAQPAEMIIVDASQDDQTEQVCKSPAPGLKTKIIYRRATHVGAAPQRNQAIAYASQDFIWFIDDDVVFEPDCLKKLWEGLQSDPKLGGVNAMIINQQYKAPGFVSRMLFQFLNGRPEKSYAGKCIGPAFNLLPEDSPNLPEVVPVEWLNTTCTLYRREALPEPWFPSYFKDYSMLEDVALSLRVARKWKLANIRSAQIFHQDVGGDHKQNPEQVAEMAFLNRHFVMTKILGREMGSDYIKLIVLQFFELFSVMFYLKRLNVFLPTLRGKLKAIPKIIAYRRQSRSAETNIPETIYPLW